MVAEDHPVVPDHLVASCPDHFETGRQRTVDHHVPRIGGGFDVDLYFQRIAAPDLCCRFTLHPPDFGQEDPGHGSLHPDRLGHGRRLGAIFREFASELRNDGGPGIARDHDPPLIGRAGTGDAPAVLLVQDELLLEVPRAHLDPDRLLRSRPVEIGPATERGERGGRVEGVAEPPFPEATEETGQQFGSQRIDRPDLVDQVEHVGKAGRGTLS